MRENFFNKKSQYITLEKALELTGSTLNKQTDLTAKINDIATLENAKNDQISFLSSGQYFNKFKESLAGFCLVDEVSSQKVVNKNMVCLINKNPYFAYSQIASMFYEEKPTEFYNEKFIHPDARIGKNSIIAPNAYIGKNVVIGDGCYVGPGSVIMDNCQIGDYTVINSAAVISFAIIGRNCLVHNGAMIGQDGFGFAHHQGTNHKIMQLGIVEIKDHVEIGANTCIDRGAIENTIIGEGTKIDNLVQIGHNVVIGKSVVIAGKTAIAGSAKIGNYVQIGGGSNVGGHIEIGDMVKIAGMSGIMRDIAKSDVVAGIPAMPIRDWHKINLKLQSLIKAKKS